MSTLARKLRTGQRCRILTVGLDGMPPVLVHESADRLYEAPNWTSSGELVLNGDGLLWKVPAAGGEPEQIPVDGVPELNNDHVISPDGRTLYVSATDWHVHAVPITGGFARRVTPDDGILHFVHGISPDGETLTYTGLRLGESGIASATIFTMRLGASPVEVTCGGPDDGSEFSPDGAWIYFNTEDFGNAAGHAQIVRTRPDGSDRQRLTHDERVNWFPHISPDGNHAYYLSYPPGTTGHPADHYVELRLVFHGDWSNPHTILETFGGQGTANVNAWSPDSSRFAYVDYPLD